MGNKKRTERRRKINKISKITKNNGGWSFQLSSFVARKIYSFPVPLFLILLVFNLVKMLTVVRKNSFLKSVFHFLLLVYFCYNNKKKLFFLPFFFVFNLLLLSKRKKKKKSREESKKKLELNIFIDLNLYKNGW